MKKELYLIDGSSYIYRAYHALIPLSNSSGLPTHAVLGFVNMVNRLLREKKPAYIAIAFDSKGPVFRHAMYEDYKANRPPMPDDLSVQIPYIKKFVEASNIAFLEQQGVEADDLIASVVKKGLAKGYKIVLVSGDKDLLQLVCDDVAMWDPMKNKVMDGTEVYKKYNVQPENLLDLYALIGDSSDNIPGVPGVGPKTAEKLINSYGSLDGLYERIDELKHSKMKEKIIENQQLAYLSRDLIRLKTDVEVVDDFSKFLFRPATADALTALYSELGFVNLLKNIDTAKPVPVEGFSLVRTVAELEEMIAVLKAGKILVIDTETTSLDGRCAELVGLSLCADLDRAWYVPVGHLDGEGKRMEGQLTVEELMAPLRPLLLSKEVTKVGHNLKYDITVLRQQAGIEVSGELADTLIAAHLTESGGRSLKLDDLCRLHGLKLTPFEEVTGGDREEGCFARVDIEKACNYSCEDVYGALVLWREFEPILRKKNLMDLFRRVEMPIVSILAEMEISGICIDNDVLAKLSVEFLQRLDILEQEIYALAGHEFNVNSPKQLAVVLFDELKLPHGRKTKTGYSTDVKVLEKLAGKHDLPAKILQYRTLAKLQSTYVEKLSRLKDDVTGRIHTSFNQAVTVTGRLSSSDPNLQNIPIRTSEGNRIRAAFVPDRGMKFVAADYSQIDLRVLAHYSGDRSLSEAFQAGEDIHTRTAAEIFMVSPLLVTSEMRRVAKSINFGIVYGMSSFGLASQLKISRKDAQRFIDKYFRLYEGVQSFMADIVQQARRDGYVTTLLQRRRSVPDIDAKNKTRREFAERTAINTPIQGTAADIIKLAMIRCREAIRENNFSAKMLLQIHDELVFEVPEAEVEETVPILREAMEGAMELNVPLVVNMEVGDNLAK